MSQLEVTKKEIHEAFQQLLQSNFKPLNLIVQWVLKGVKREEDFLIKLKLINAHAELSFDQTAFLKNYVNHIFKYTALLESDPRPLQQKMYIAYLTAVHYPIDQR